MVLLLLFALTTIYLRVSLFCQSTFPLTFISVFLSLIYSTCLAVFSEFLFVCVLFLSTFVCKFQFKFILKCAFGGYLSLLIDALRIKLQINTFFFFAFSRKCLSICVGFLELVTDVRSILKTETKISLPANNCLLSI